MNMMVVAKILIKHLANRTFQAKRVERAKSKTVKLMDTYSKTI